MVSDPFIVIDFAACPEGLPPPHPQAVRIASRSNPYPSLFIYPPNFMLRQYLQEDCEFTMSISLRFD
jgi:hypothetical protein